MDFNSFLLFGEAKGSEEIPRQIFAANTKGRMWGDRARSGFSTFVKYC